MHSESEYEKVKVKVQIMYFWVLYRGVDSLNFTNGPGRSGPARAARVARARPG